MDFEKTGRNRRSYLIAAIAMSMLIFVVLRARWIGHLLTWDEAMNLCAVRALVTVSRDHFSNWFWRHPPLFSVLTLALKPLRDGFAERVEILALVTGVVNMGLLYLLNRRVFGRTAAVLSIFFLAVMPGSMFFDVWVKRDHMVATFGLAALLLLFSSRPLWAGLCLGFALLTKETAVFYALAAGILWLSGAAGKRYTVNFLALTLTPLFACIWWYHLSFAAGDTPAPGASWLDAAFGSATEHVRLALNANSGWGRPWHFYAGLLPDMLGTVGILLAVVGVVAVGTAYRLPNPAQHGPDAPRPTAVLWPLTVLLPSYLVLSCLRSKVPWVPMSMFPAWATLQGVALTWLLRTGRSGANEPGNGGNPPLSRIALAAVILIGSLHHASKQDYDGILHNVAPGQQRGAQWSRDAAVAMNMATRDTDRILLTSFHYWQGIAPGQACPVFAYYYKRQAAVLMKPYETSFADLSRSIREHRIDWALLSPMPGVMEQEVFGGFVEQLKLQPIKFDRAWLFRTTRLYEPGKQQ